MKITPPISNYKNLYLRPNKAITMNTILLIQPYVYHSNVGTISPWEVPSLGLAYIAAVLEKHGYSVKVIDAHIEQLSLEALYRRIIKLEEEFGPINPIGITANGYSAKYAAETALYLKKRMPEKIYVMGGPYPTAKYNMLLKGKICDICVLGEGEYTFLEIVRLISPDLEAGGSLDGARVLPGDNIGHNGIDGKADDNGSIKPDSPIFPDSLYDIRGIAFNPNNDKLSLHLGRKMSGQESDPGKIGESLYGMYSNKSLEIVTTPPRPHIMNLDELPFPAWHLFPPLKKYKNLRGVTYKPFAPIMTSRGCPYRCNWCTKNIHGYRFRARSAQNVFEEIKRDVKEFGIKEIAIMDDTFSLNRKRVKELCILLIKNDVKVFLNLYNGIRADTVSDSLLKYLTSVGVNRITIGVESGNQEIVKKVGKSLDLKKVLEAVRLAKKYRLIVDGYFILGHPYDTVKTMQETIDFAIKSDLDHAYFFTATPFPGTELYDIVKKHHRLLRNVDFGSDAHIVQGIASFETENFSAEQVEYYYHEAYRRFYFRPKKIWSLAVVYGRFLLQYRSLQEMFWLISQFLHLIKQINRKDRKDSS